MKKAIKYSIILCVISWVYAAIMIFGLGIKNPSDNPMKYTKGGNDLINGASGVSGFIVISIVIAIIYVVDKYVLKDNIFTKTIGEVLEDVER